MMHGQPHIRFTEYPVRIQRSRYSESLRTGRSGERILVGARFSSPVQTGPGAHPTSYTMATGSFPGVKRPGRGVNHPPISSAEVKERIQLYICSPFGPSWLVVRWTSLFYPDVHFAAWFKSNWVKLRVCVCCSLDWTWLHWTRVDWARFW